MRPLTGVAGLFSGTSSAGVVTAAPLVPTRQPRSFSKHLPQNLGSAAFKSIGLTETLSRGFSLRLFPGIFMTCGNLTDKLGGNVFTTARPSKILKDLLLSNQFAGVTIESAKIRLIASIDPVKSKARYFKFGASGKLIAALSSRTHTPERVPHSSFRSASCSIKTRTVYFSGSAFTPHPTARPSFSVL